jgi:hypothetical protein
MYLADTFPDNRGMFRMVDTGDAHDGNYVNFDYQFSQNSVDEQGKTSGGVDTVFHIAPRPGYAGFKFFWDYGSSSFWVSDFDSMILWHKGPLPGHKVMMIWASASAGCGTPICYEYFGEFNSSSIWTRESFPFPLTRGNSAHNPYPNSPFLKDGLYELRMLINNDSTVSTSPTSAVGDLKIDDIYFLQLPLHAPVMQTQPQSQTVKEGETVTFKAYARGGVGGAPTYQWLKNGDTIPDATFYMYTIDSAQLSDAGSYSVVATNGMGSVTSDAATLTVNAPAAPAKKGCGCGSGTGLALIPPLFFKAMAHRKRKKKNPKT